VKRRRRFRRCQAAGSATTALLRISRTGRAARSAACPNRSRVLSGNKSHFRLPACCCLHLLQNLISTTERTADDDINVQGTHLHAKANKICYKNKKNTLNWMALLILALENICINQDRIAFLLFI